MAWVGRMLGTPTVTNGGALCVGGPARRHGWARARYLAQKEAKIQPQPSLSCRFQLPMSTAHDCHAPSTDPDSSCWLNRLLAACLTLLDMHRWIWPRHAIDQRFTLAMRFSLLLCPACVWPTWLRSALSRPEAVGRYRFVVWQLLPQNCDRPNAAPCFVWAKPNSRSGPREPSVPATCRKRLR